MSIPGLIFSAEGNAALRSQERESKERELSEIYESIPRSKMIRDYLVKLANEENFSRQHFDATKNEWNIKHTMRDAGHGRVIESIPCMHGSVSVLYKGDDKLNFDFANRTI